MHKTSLILFFGLFVLLYLWFGFADVAIAEQMPWCLALIFGLGIPHGAIDHVLYFENTKEKPYRFYGTYLGLILSYVLCWIFFPKWSLLFFLIVSAYHFGQSQFSDLVISEKALVRLLHLAWGVSILSGLFWYNHTDLIAVFQGVTYLAKLTVLFELRVLGFLSVISSVICIGVMLYLSLRSKLGLWRFLMETLVLGLIHLCFFTLPLVIGFAVYFATLHSLKVLSEEFSFLQRNRFNFSLPHFLRMLLPYTLISVLGIFVLLGIARVGWLGIPEVLMVFILLSVITLPHSIVMDRFYAKLYH